MRFGATRKNGSDDNTPTHRQREGKGFNEIPGRDDVFLSNATFPRLFQAHEERRSVGAVWNGFVSVALSALWPTDAPCDCMLL